MRDIILPLLTSHNLVIPDGSFVPALHSDPQNVLAVLLRDNLPKHSAGSRLPRIVPIGFFYTAIPIMQPDSFGINSRIFPVSRICADPAGSKHLMVIGTVLYSIPISAVHRKAVRNCPGVEVEVNLLACFQRADIPTVVGYSVFAGYHLA